MKYTTILDLLIGNIKIYHTTNGGLKFMELDQAVEKILMDITNNEEGSVSIIECILNGKTFDSEIAEETEIKLNKVRKILYKFHEAGVLHTKEQKS